VLESLDADAVRRWCAISLASLRRHQHEIDELNVFPVPDGDTGTNLVLTFTSAAERLEATPPGDLKTTLSAFARGALLGARGNSGVIVSELLSGLCSAVRVTVVAGRALAAGLTEAAEAAYRAVAAPVEGTMLSVAKGAALAATATNTDNLAEVARAAAAGAAEALARTPEQLAALARAGVVDAGGRGLVVLLDALVEVITGEVTQHPPEPVRRPANTVRESGSAAYAFEVQFLLDAHDDDVEELKKALSGLGDSLAVVGIGLMTPAATHPTWNVHVHVNDVGAALETAVRAGRPHRISVTHFDTQIAEQQHEPAAITPADGAPPHAPRATVVVAAGDGLAALFEAEGAVVVQGPNPSTAEILQAIRATGVQRVVVLPNISATHATASAAAAEARTEGVRAAVVPTRSPVQALAALAVRDAGRRFEDDIIAMAEAAGACRYAEVTHASREALTVAGRCEPGDVLALVEGEVNMIGKDLHDTCHSLLDRLLAGGGELVTLIIGAEAPDGFAERLRTHLAQRWPFVEAQIYDGGQPHHPLLVGIE
jgi:fatty acid kinase